MSYERPPYDASADNVEVLCREFRDVSGLEREELKEETDELQGTTFDRNLEAAVHLGFFTEEDDEFKPTKDGKKIGYEKLSEEEKEKLYREQIQNYEFYNELLRILSGELVSEDGTQYLPRDRVQSEMGINFELDVGDRTLESAAGTFLKLLEECGVGKYVQGRGDHPTRLVVNERFPKFVSELTTEKDVEAESDQTAEQADLSIAEPEQNTSSEEGANQEINNQDEEEHDEISISNKLDGEIQVDVTIEISSSDWDCESVISLIDSIRSQPE